MSGLENHQKILKQLIEKTRSDFGVEKESDAFDLLVADMVTRQFSLSYDELGRGITDGGDDGTIDAVYIFIDGTLIHPDEFLPNTEITSSQRPTIEIVIIQGTTAKTFSENKIKLLSTHLDDLLMQNPTGSYQYNQDILDSFVAIKSIIDKLALKRPSIIFRVYYAAFSESSSVNHKLELQKSKIVQDIINKFSTAQVEFDFLGCDQLFQIYSIGDETRAKLNLSGSQELSISDSYILLVPLKEYLDFISDENKKLRHELFEANVRDYQHSVTVNKRISQTLRGEQSTDFWWLNNGVTIVCDEANKVGGVLTLLEPSIVNGLQTSFEIYNASKLSEDEFQTDTRKVLVKIISAKNPNLQASIIEATNSQTPIGPASLKGLAPIHRKIEAFLSQRDLFYERRKGFYKNRGKPREKVVSLTEMAQAVMAIYRWQPSSARARPTSLIREDQTHETIFSDTQPLELYHDAVLIVREVEKYLAENHNELDRRNRNNIKFHTATYMAVKAGHGEGNWEPDKARVAVLKHLRKASNDVKEIYKNLGGDDAVAKSSEFTDDIVAKAAGKSNKN